RLGGGGWVVEGGAPGEGGRAGSPPATSLRKNAEFLVHVAADIHSLMAGYASVGFEQSVALLLRLRQHVPLTAQIAIKTSIGRQQGPLEAGESSQHVGSRQAFGVSVVEP